MKLRVYQSDESNKWNSVLRERFGNQVDVYYRPEYLQSWVACENAEPICLHLIEGDLHFLYPFFKKEIALPDEKDKYYDIYSAYGYGGMICNCEGKHPDASDLAVANNLVDNWCHKHHIVAEFIRQNPLLGSGDRYLRSSSTVEVRQNAYAGIDRNYHIPSTSARRNINKARRKGLKVYVDHDLSTMDRFAELYHQTSIRLKMDAYYDFGKKYFQDVKDRLGPWSKIVNVLEGDKIVAASIVYLSGQFGTYHLSCSDESALKLRPNDFLLASIVKEIQKYGAKWLNFGGGMTKDPDDSLLAFKKRFGSIVRKVHIGKKVHLPAIYEKLCSSWEKRHPDLAEQYRHFFLKYRIGPK